MVVTPIDALPDVGAYWKAQGGVWGGEFNDPIHFEYPGFEKPHVFKPNLYDETINFLASFVPYVGGAQFAAFLLAQFFPSLEQTEIYDMLQNPILHLEQWASFQKRWIG